ncbi:hypothetical protein [Frankia sp. Cj3]|uniref:hypothetical protein n=1 Tax=Frankia sp. Cj3 TaxID=2880976 RepID=UPI001EF648A6|nr:hypothetical protein [Frankia sp. Cj3]
MYKEIRMLVVVAVAAGTIGIAATTESSSTATIGDVYMSIPQRPDACPGGDAVASAGALIPGGSASAPPAA